MSDFSYIIERLSTRAKKVLISAQEFCEQLGDGNIDTHHLLYSILAEKNSLGIEILFTNPKILEKIKKEIIKKFSLAKKTKKETSGGNKISKSLIQVLEKSALIASKYNFSFISTEHLLYGIVDIKKNLTTELLKKNSIDIGSLKEQLLIIFDHNLKFTDLLNFDESIQIKDKPIIKTEKISKSPALDYFTVDLNDRAEKGFIDPVIGRTEEIDRVITVLNRRTKNNPVLIGLPGVGKTAIAEGLALSIVNKNVPENLLDKRVLALDLALIVAGSMFRGEFENRLKQVIDELSANQNTILFIDELHTLVGAGATTGSLDAANILKPALARGDIRAIGATTLAEYKKYIEEDAALERRFQPIIIDEPTPEQTIEIIKGIRSKYEKHHGVMISNEAIDSAVELSVQYITGKYLPDKAIDLIDESSANLKIKNEKLLISPKNNIRKSITSEDIAYTLSKITGIPAKTLLQNEITQLKNLEQSIGEHIKGQTEAISAISNSIRRARLGISSKNRPLGSFIFLGPSGVGKTELAKVLAEKIYKNKNALVRVDMSEFMERHNISRLIGAPAGYVGYGEGGRLTEEIRRKPYSIILFDEIEKAHPDVFNILLQILEDGQLTDSAGTHINFRNTIVIMTSNIGTSELNKQAEKFGFVGVEKKQAKKQYEEIKENIIKTLNNIMRPELLNRIDKILVFKALSVDSLKEIINKQLESLKDRLAKTNIELKWDKQSIDVLAKKSQNSEQGARLVRKNIAEFIEDKIAIYIVKKLNLSKKEIIKVKIKGKNNKIELEFTK